MSATPPPRCSRSVHVRGAYIHRGVRPGAEQVLSWAGRLAESDDQQSRTCYLASRAAWLGAVGRHSEVGRCATRGPAMDGSLSEWAGRPDTRSQEGSPASVATPRSALGDLDTLRDCSSIRRTRFSVPGEPPPYIKWRGRALPRPARGVPRRAATAPPTRRSRNPRRRSHASAHRSGSPWCSSNTPSGWPAVGSWRPPSSWPRTRRRPWLVFGPRPVGGAGRARHRRPSCRGDDRRVPDDAAPVGVRSRRRRERQPRAWSPRRRR